MQTATKKTKSKKSRKVKKAKNKKSKPRESAANKASNEIIDAGKLSDQENNAPDSNAVTTTLIPKNLIKNL